MGLKALIVLMWAFLFVYNVEERLAWEGGPFCLGFEKRFRKGV